MLMIYKRLTKVELEEMAIMIVDQVSKWFAANPKRKTCCAQVWYGKTATFHRDRLSEQVLKLRNEQIKKSEAIIPREEDGGVPFPLPAGTKITKAQRGAK